MVKIKAKPILLGIVIFTLLMGVAHAAGSAHLLFKDVDVKVGSKTSNNRVNGDTISEQAKPGDAVEFRVTVQNNYTTLENLRIKDITVKTTIESIDDGNDFEEESNSFDISPGSDKRVTLKFDVPLQVDEDTFNVIIRAEGEDKNGTNQVSEMNLKLEVNKDSHAIKILRSTLSPTEVTCSRKNIRLDTSILNIGTEDEQDVTVQVLNSDLGIDLKSTISELSAGGSSNDADSTFSKVYSFNLPNNIEAGSYPITFRVLYNNDRKKSETVSTLTVNGCNSQENKTNSNVQVITNPVYNNNPTQPAPPVVVQPLPPDTTVTEEGFLKSNTFVVAIIIAEIVAVIVGIVLIVTLFARRG